MKIIQYSQLYNITHPTHWITLTWKRAIISVNTSTVAPSCHIHTVTRHSLRVEEEIEAMYIQRRFQGLSLEEQRRIQQRKKGKKVERRRSSAAESRGSQLTPHSRGGKIRSANPFGLQVRNKKSVFKISRLVIKHKSKHTVYSGKFSFG